MFGVVKMKKGIVRYVPSADARSMQTAEHGWMVKVQD
jgi:hypothetical protein